MLIETATALVAICTVVNAVAAYFHCRPVKAQFVDEKPAIITLSNADHYQDFEPGMLVQTSSSCGCPDPKTELPKQSWLSQKWSSFTAQVAVFIMLALYACGCATAPSNGIPANGSDAYNEMKSAQWAYHAAKVSCRTACKAPTKTVALVLVDGEWQPILPGNQ
jgi:hypothetical protein